MSQFIDTYTWAIEVFAVIFIALIFSYIETVIYKRIVPKLEDKNHDWQVTFLKAAHAPLHAIIWLFGVTFAGDIAAEHAKDFTIFALICPFRKIATAILVVWFFIRLVRGIEEQMTREAQSKGRFDQTTVKAISQLLRVSILITAALILLQSFGVPVAGVVTFGGISAAAVGFAAKDLLANFFGGFMIFLDRPFAIGDWIRSPDRELEGVVENIGWRLTRIRTFDKRPLYIPNGIFSNISIENPSRMHNRRIKTTVGVRYGDVKALPVILTDLRTMIADHQEIDKKQSCYVNFNEFGPSSLNIYISCYTKTTNRVKYLNVQEDIFLKALEIVSKHGAEVAFPTQTLHVAEIPGQ